MTSEPEQQASPTPLDNAPTPDTASDAVRLVDAPEGETSAPRGKSLWREYTEAIVVAMILAFAIRIFIVQAFKIPSGSMIPTLLIGDHILVSKLSYGIQWPGDCKLKATLPPISCAVTRHLVIFGSPQRGDVIVFRYPEDEDKDFIKRVVGLPGDTVQIRNKTVYINGDAITDQWYTQRVDPGMIDGTVNPRDNFGPVTVPEDSFFVMGDNRDQSLDSRFWGYVREEKIRGRALRIYWSWKGQGAWQEWVRWDRIGKAIQ
ncbi:MAG: signal peptidase I [Nitrospira sp.]|nr:signal peptidase I [Nitrospira sp.]